MRRGTRPRRRATSSPLTFLGGLLALYLLGPIVLFTVRAREGDVGLGPDGFGADGLGDAVFTSLISASLSTLVIVVLGVPLARVLARAHGWFARAVGVAVQLPLALPPVMSGIVLIYLVGPYTWAGEHLPLTNSLAGVVVAQTFVAAPFLVIAARSAFASINPDVDDLAATLGVTAFGRFWRVDLPLAMPGIVAGALLTWLRALGEYGATSLIAYHPSTLPVYTSVQFAGSGLAGTSAPTLVALALAAVVLVGVNLPWRTPSRPVRPPAAEAPPHLARTPVAFTVNHRVGGFHLVATYAATSHRLAVLGPSGSGKTLLLRSLAGLVAAENVIFDGEDVTDTPVEQRRIGYVPQDRLLFEHRSVWRNVTFSPRAIPARAAWWLAELDLAALAERSTRGLSGGERQRASLVQALAGENRLLLLDEPFSALDTPTRLALVARLRHLQRQENLSSVIVTHDPQEALMLADEVLLLDGGRVLQAGPVPDVFARPCSVRAARLLGLDDVIAVTCVRDGELAVAPGFVVPAPGARGGQPYLARLPRTCLRVHPEGVAVQVRDVVPSGTHDMVVVALGEHDVRFDAPPGGPIRPDATVHVTLRSDEVRWWPVAISPEPKCPA